MVRDRIMQPYTRRVEDTRHRVSRVALIGGLVLLAMILGFMTAILPVQLVIIPLVPVILLAALALWIAPDMDTNYDATIRTLWLLFLAAVLVWPDYVALTVPGIGWLSLQRLFLAMMFFVSLYALAMSSATRAHVMDVIGHVKPVYWFFLLMVILQILVAAAWMRFSGRFVFGLIFWYYMFILAAWACSKPNTVMRMYQILLIGFAIQCVYGLAEYQLQYPPWAPHIPAWLRVDPTLLENIIGFEGRSTTGVYRIGSIYFTSVTYAEAIAIFVPFVIFGIFYGRNAWIRIAAVALLIFAFQNGWWTGARTAMVGFLIAAVSMIGLWGLQRYRRKLGKADIWGPAVLWAYPFVAVLAGLAVLFVKRVRTAVLGGDVHKHSNDAREEQWRRTWDLVERNPLGYGPFSSGDRINYANPAGQRTVDGYAMSLLVDYGLLGLLLFSLFFLGCIVVALRTFLNSNGREEDLSAPLAVALVSFLFVRLISSQTEIFWVEFGLAGAVIGLHWRQQQRLKVEAAARPPAPAEPVQTAPRPRGPLVPVGGYGVAHAR